MRTGDRPLWESERAAPRLALLGRRQSARLPSRPIPGGGRDPLAYLFVAERGDPRLPFVELLLEVAVLRKHGRAGSSRPPGVRCAPAPRAAAPPTKQPRERGRPQRTPSFPGRVPHARRPGSAARGRLPVAAASSGQLAGRGGGRGHPAARPEPCKFAGRGACASECECVPGEGGGTKSQVNTASPCRAKLINIQVAS